MKLVRNFLLWGMFVIFLSSLPACARTSTITQPPVKSIRVVMDNNYPPYVFQDAEGHVQGILIDQWKLWEQKTGVKVEITALPWGEALEAMRSGQFDVIDTIFYTEDRAQVFDFTDPYASIDVYIFFNNNVSGLAQVSDLKGFRVAVKSGDANADYLIEQGITDLVYYNSYEEIVRAAVANNEAVFVMDQPPALYYLYKFNAQGDFRYSEPLYGGHFHRAVLKGNTALLELVSEGFSRISPAEYDTIDARWFGQAHNAEILKFAPYLWGGLALGAIGFLALFIFNQMLRSRVHSRTRELQQALQDLRKSEARFREAIEFLPIPIAIADEAGRILLVNHKFTENYGYIPQDIPTVETWMLRAYPDPQDREKVLAVWNKDVAQATENGESTPLREYQITCQDGSKCDVEIVMHPVSGLWVASFNNITERKIAEAKLRETELIFSSFLEHSPIFVFFKDKDIRSVRLSRNYEQMLGMPVEDALGKSMDELFPSDLAKSMVADDMRILNEGKRIDIVEEFDNHIYETTKFPIYIDGKPEMLAGFTMDITERKRAEEALRKSEEQLHKKNELLYSILESPKGIIIFSLDKNYCYTAYTVSHQETMKAIWDVDISQGACMLDVIPNQDDREKAKSNFDRALQGEHFIINEEYGDHSLRRSFWEDHYSPIVNEDGEVVGLTVFVIDISERIQAEMALRDSENRLRTVTENAPDTILQIDSQGIINFINRTVPGLTREQVLGSSVYQWVPEEQHPVLARTLELVFTTGERQEYESLGPGPDGEYRSYSVRVMPVVIDGKAESAIYIATDITARIHAEQALRESEENYRHLVELSPDAIIVHRDGNIIFANTSSIRLMHAQDASEIIGKPAMSFVHPDSRTDAAARIQHMLTQSERVPPIEEKFICLDGEVVDVEVVAMPVTYEGKPAIQVIARDITERKKMMDELIASEEKYRTLIETINTGIFMSTLDGRFVQANSAVVEISGYDSIEEFLTLPAQKLYADVRDREMITAQLMAEGLIKNAEVRSVKKDGTVYWISISAVLLKDATGKPTGLLGSVTDITERKNTEDIIQKNEKRWRTLIEKSADALTLLKSDGSILYEGPTVQRLTGYTPEERYGRSALENIIPEDLPMVRQVLSTIMDSPGSSTNLEFRSTRKDGSIWWIEGTATNLLKDPDVQAVVVNYRDITARRNANEELRNSENRFRILFEHAGMGVAQSDSLSGQILRVNQKYCEIVGYPREELEALKFQDITYPDDLQADLENMERLRNGEISEFQMEKRYVRKDGTLVWVVLVVSPLWAPGEPPSTHIAVVHDITEQKRAEYALRYSEAEVRKLNAELEHRVVERTAQLEAANKELEAFAYSVSHDLRAPLRAIDGFSRIFLDSYANQLDDEGRMLLDRVRQANQNMTQLVDALLGLSRMSRAELHHGRVDLSALAYAIIEELQGHSPKRSVDWQVQEGLSAEGDARLLRVVLENLLGNALKFTAQQENSTITFGMKEFDGEKAYFVRDNGAGFDMKYAGKLFGAFQRLHSAAEFEGTGIGLATVQRVIHRHSGRVWAESEVGKGATFYFTLGKSLP